MNEAAYRRCLMPLPRTLETLEGPPLTLGGSWAPRYDGVRTPRLERAVARFAAAVGTSAGSARPVPLHVRCDGAGASVPALEDDESYALTISRRGAGIRAPREWGVLRALSTLTQLCADVDALPPLRIVDEPRFPWRGLMLDVARHFIPVGDLLRTLDAMAAFRLNVLHLHLSDDQGFRFPSRRHPRLASADHYTLAELEDLVAQAADRGIRVVPELDVPGHASSWLEAHPDWGNRPLQPSRRFGVHQACLDPSRPAVQEAVAELFGELAAVFPDRFLHIGGDEVHPAWWSADGGVRAFMAAHGLADTAALQSWFNRYLTDVLRGLGRDTVGWDEVLHPDLPASVVVQAWRGATARDRALAAGHRCVVSAPYYLDLFYPADVHYAFDPEAPQQALLAREDALLGDARFAHVAGGMAWTRQWRENQVDQVPAEAGGQLLGAEACLWSELVDGRVLDVRLWSRMPALAERFWSPRHCSDVDDMYQRLTGVLEHLPRWAGVDVGGDARRLTGEAGVTDAWQPLVDMLEPVKWYGRLLGEEAMAARLRGREMPQARPYDADTPLNRVVDALPPESLAARRLAAVCRKEAEGDTASRAELRRAAAAWRHLPEDGGPAELGGLARDLRTLGALVEAVLDGSCEPDEARPKLQAAAVPKGEYLLAPALVLSGWLDRRGATQS